MKQILRLFLSGLAAFSRSFNREVKRIRYKNDLALLKAQLIQPMRTHLEIASAQCAIDIELQDPALREIFDSIETPDLSGSTTSFPSANVAEKLQEFEKTCQRDSAFAALLAHTEQELSSELQEIRRKLQANRKLREAFSRIFNASDALDSLKLLGSLKNPTTPPSHTLIHETDQLAALLRDGKPTESGTAGAAR